MLKTTFTIDRVIDRYLVNFEKIRVQDGAGSSDGDGKAGEEFSAKRQSLLSMALYKKTR